MNRISIGPHQAPERVPLLAVEEAVVGEEVWRGVEAGAEEGAAWSRGAEVPFSRAEEAGEDGGGGLGRGCGDTVALCSGCSSGYTTEPSVDGLWKRRERQGAWIRTSWSVWV